MKKKVIKKEFASAAEFAAYANTVPVSCHSRESSAERDEWAGGSFEDAVHYATYGNPEYVKQLFDGVSMMQHDVEEAASAYVRDVEGQFFDVADVMSGEPEHWWREDSQPSRKVIRIWVSIVHSSSCSTSEIINRGAAIVALCDALQKDGCIVEVQCVWGSQFNPRTRRGSGPVHQAVITPSNTPLDIDELAYLIANPTSNRRLAFAFLEKETKTADCGGYGPIAEVYGDEDFIFPTIRESLKSWRTIDQARRNIMDAIERHNADPSTPVKI